MTDVTAAESYPRFPPGFWRRIVIAPVASGTVVAALEDDAHRMWLRLSQQDGVVAAVAPGVERVPYPTCPGAADVLVRALIGRPLASLSSIDAREHCTHLYDLAGAIACFPVSDRPVCFDMKVGDRVDERTTATLHRDGDRLILWQIKGTCIEGPENWAGRDLRRLSEWAGELDPATAGAARLLRRSVYVSGVRRQPEDREINAADVLARRGACYTYRLPQAFEAGRKRGWRKDFSQGAHLPLEGFDPFAC